MNLQSMLGVVALSLLTASALSDAPSTVGAKPAAIVIAHRGASGYLPEHTLEAKAYIVALGQQVKAAKALDLETNYTIRSTSLMIITREMSNDILADALKAALWRLFRWRMAEAAAEPSGIDPRLPVVMERMAQATQIGTVRALFEAQQRPSDA